MARRRTSPAPSLPFFPPAAFANRSAPPLSAPWQPVFADAALVIPMRLALLPWLMLVDPAAGKRESRLMVDEKSAAFAESLAGLWFAPFRYWAGLATLSIAPGARGVERALAEANREASRPYARRVRANRKRLARPLGSRS